MWIIVISSEDDMVEKWLGRLPDSKKFMGKPATNGCLSSPFYVESSLEDNCSAY